MTESDGLEAHLRFSDHNPLLFKVRLFGLVVFVLSSSDPARPSTIAGSLKYPILLSLRLAIVHIPLSFATHVGQAIEHKS